MRWRYVLIDGPNRIAPLNNVFPICGLRGNRGTKGKADINNSFILPFVLSLTYGTTVVGKRNANWIRILVKTFYSIFTNTFMKNLWNDPPIVCSIGMYIAKRYCDLHDMVYESIQLVSKHLAKKSHLYSPRQYEYGWKYNLLHLGINLSRVELLFPALFGSRIILLSE